MDKNTNLKSAVKLPPGEKLEDWISTNTMEFFNQISFLAQSLSEVCTVQTCPIMSAGPNFQYYWQDPPGPNQRYKTPTMVPAPEYISNVIMWTEQLINDENIFPSDPSAQYPKEFVSIVSNIFKRLFRIFAHIYHHHSNDISQIGNEVVLNKNFQHFTLFAREFRLIPDEQLVPLAEIIPK